MSVATDSPRDVCASGGVTPRNEVVMLFETTLPLGLWSRLTSEPSEYRPDLGPCWIWHGATNGKGYGKFRIGPWGVSPDYVYRLTYKAFVGAIPAGLILDHLCRVSLCGNPRHVEPVTQQENCRRGLQGVLTTHCPRGHAYSPENLIARPAGKRDCKICHRDRMRVRHHGR